MKEAYKNGAIQSFARHSRLGYKSITLKTGSYGMEALAMSIKFATDAKLVCMGRYLMIPAYLGANIEGALFPKNIVDEFGATPEEIFAGYSDVKFCINNGLSPHGEEPVLEFFYRRFWKA